MFERFVERRAEEALSDTPVVLIVGPRRAGKTTLVRKMGEAGRTYITLDDQTVLEAAQSDPAGFIRGLGGLRALAEASGERFAFGVILYDSADAVPFGDRLAAAPLSSLWNREAPTKEAGKSR